MWLEHYRVHLMIRRVIYSPVGHRNASLTYGQVFDDNWNEMEDAALAIQTPEERSIASVAFRRS